jgi:hypothetical protein
MIKKMLKQRVAASGSVIISAFARTVWRKPWEALLVYPVSRMNFVASTPPPKYRPKILGISQSVLEFFMNYISLRELRST